MIDYLTKKIIYKNNIRHGKYKTKQYYQYT